MHRLTCRRAVSLLALLSLSARAQPAIDEATPARGRFTLGIQAGLTYWTEKGPVGTDIGIGRALLPGYNIGLRSSYELTRWLAIDSRAHVMRNAGNDLVQGGATTTFGGFGAARFTLPTQVLQPYALVGGGAYRVSASGPGTALASGTFPALEFGFGAVVPTGKNFEVGVEYLFNVLLAETLSKNPAVAGGDPSTFSAFVQYRF